MHNIVMFHYPVIYIYMYIITIYTCTFNILTWPERFGRRSGPLQIFCVLCLTWTSHGSVSSRHTPGAERGYGRRQKSAGRCVHVALCNNQMYTCANQENIIK